MASLRLDNIPDDLVKRLELAASARKRELAAEVVDRLDDSFRVRRVARKRDHTELSTLARTLRGEMPGDWLTPEFIRAAREFGRE
jgi:hypothetical protein